MSTHPGEAISAWLDDELSDDEAGAVVEHLAACPACALERDEVAAGRSLLRTQAACEPPPGVLVPQAALHLGADLSAWLDGELDDERSAGAAVHVDACPACAEEVVEISAARTAVRAMPWLDPPFRARPAGGRRSRRSVGIGAAAAALVGAAAMVALAPAASADVLKMSEMVAVHDRTARAAAADQLSTGPARSRPAAGGAPASLAHGFALVALDRGPGGLLHARYEDRSGATLSLFRTPAVWATGDHRGTVDVAGRTAKRWTTAADEVVCWRTGGASYAVISSTATGPMDRAVTVEAAASVPTDGPSLLARGRHAARRLLELLA